MKKMKLTKDFEWCLKFFAKCKKSDSGTGADAQLHLYDDMENGE